MMPPHSYHLGNRSLARAASITSSKSSIIHIRNLSRSPHPRLSLDELSYRPFLCKEIISTIPPRRRRGAIVDDFAFHNALFIPGPACKSEARFGWRRRLALLPFDFADAFAAVAFEVFGEVDEGEDVFL